MREVTRKWLEFARRDLKDAALQFQNKAYEDCVWHCHQTMEKLLKAIIVEKGIKFRKTHDLINLVKDAEITLPRPILEFLEDLNPYYQPIRYPDAALLSKEAYKRPTVQKIFRKTKEVAKWLEEKLLQLK